ncbi:MAG: 16S rRNA (uracil(1498)-N(3))-methyltransferase [Lentisphaeria bacterium]|nr:16S rRNA (uracil(1498)-N(3))-methyltransferase [Lentisphaeria bacterium]
MQIRRFHIETIPAPGEQAHLAPEEAAHAVRVLRLRPGDRVWLLDGAGCRAEAVVEDLGMGRRHEGFCCRVLERVVVAEALPRVRLYVAPPRAALMSQVVRCATELGVRRLTPILCRYGVARPDGSAVQGWRRDALAAMKQSGNPFLPEIDGPTDLTVCLAGGVEPGVFGAVPEGADGNGPRAPADLGAWVGVWVGPEGGFTAEEEAALRGAGLRPWSVGHWVLRVETAVPALLGLLAGMMIHD